MSGQAEGLGIFGGAFRQGGDSEYFRAAQAIQKFLTTFLTSPDGAFYASQDADVVEGQHSARYFALNDQQRRKRGIPRVDTHMYSRENGWAITALASLYEVTADPKALEQAVGAADWVTQHRALVGGGFHHGTKDVGGPFLGDSIAMTRAYLALYRVTADRKWLKDATASMGYIDRTFRGTRGAGFVSSAVATDHAYRPHPQRDENVAVARAASLLFHA